MSGEQEKLIMRTIEKALHDCGLVVVSRDERDGPVIVVEDAANRIVSEVKITRQKK